MISLAARKPAGTHALSNTLCVSQPRLAPEENTRMSKNDRAAIARNRAEALWPRAKVVTTSEHDEAAEAERAKTARLRALRLAKEAADRTAAEQETARKAAVKAAAKGRRKA